MFQDLTHYDILHFLLCRIFFYLVKFFKVYNVEYALFIIFKQLYTSYKK